ncbi:MAG: hypothetical protein IJT57_00560 [Selenomonadaceae bacterium]|nr:hypothetical protein [Selenomonadaceae bacterium]
MRGAKIFSAMAAAIILAAGASGECASANVRVEVNVETGNKPAHVVKRPVDDYASMAEGDYTGLIIDCRGLGLKTAMSPVIENVNGSKIYGHKDLDIDRIIREGMVDYVSDPHNVSRAGTNPLIVRAVALSNFNSNPVVSIADSNKILIENRATKFLHDLRVVFLF